MAFPFIRYSQSYSGQANSLALSSFVKSGAWYQLSNPEASKKETQKEKATVSAEESRTSEDRSYAQEIDVPY